MRGVVPFEYEAKRHRQYLEDLRGKLWSACIRGNGVWGPTPEECTEIKKDIQEEMDKVKATIDYYSGRANEYYKMMNEYGGDPRRSNND